MSADRIADESSSNHRFDPLTKMGTSPALALMANFPNSYAASNQYNLNPRISKAISACCIRRVAEMIRFLKEETLSLEYRAEWLAKQ